MSTKEILRDIADKLPADQRWQMPYMNWKFRAGIEQGLAELDCGEGMPIEDVKKQLPQWLGK